MQLVDGPVMGASSPALLSKLHALLEGAGA
jgi:hypothetical protein